MTLADSVAGPDPITVRVLKYDGTEYRRWNARLARREGSLIVLDAEFETDVEHESLGTVPRGTRTLEYYWLDRWYNVFQFLKENGGTRLFYCNVNMPPKLEGGTLVYVDLDIDVLVQPDLSYEILDLEEFADHARILQYPQEVQESARKALTEIISRVEGRQFPFNE
ncbi:MAG: DUF402 domain-containing protein [Pyrinomonadaceae bacterium]